LRVIISWQSQPSSNQHYMHMWYSLEHLISVSSQNATSWAARYRMTQSIGIQPKVVCRQMCPPGRRQKAEGGQTSLCSTNVECQLAIDQPGSTGCCTGKVRRTQSTHDSSHSLTLRDTMFRPHHQWVQLMLALCGPRLASCSKMVTPSPGSKTRFNMSPPQHTHLRHNTWPHSAPDNNTIQCNTPASDTPAPRQLALKTCCPAFSRTGHRTHAPPAQTRAA